MDDVMTMKEIKKRFDQEWVLLEDCVCTKDLSVKSGRVLTHSKKKNVVYKSLKKLKPHNFAVFYIGEPPEDMVYVL
jgi:hypothetical protein